MYGVDPKLTCGQVGHFANFLLDNAWYPKCTEVQDTFSYHSSLMNVDRKLDVTGDIGHGFGIYRGYESLVFSSELAFS